VPIECVSPIFDPEYSTLAEDGRRAMSWDAELSVGEALCCPSPPQLNCIQESHKQQGTAAVLSRVYTRIHVAGYKLYPLVSTYRPSTCFFYRRKNCRHHYTSPVCCWIQRDTITSRPWYKWTLGLIMSPKYSQHVSRTSNLYPSTCIRRHICIRIQVVRPGYMFAGDMCPGVDAAWGRRAMVLALLW